MLVEHHSTVYECFVVLAIRGVQRLLGQEGHGHALGLGKGHGWGGKVGLAA